MRLIAQVKLLPTPDQADAIRRTVAQANAACDFVSRHAWHTRTFGKYALQKLCYGQIRARFGLSAQVAVRVIAKVADAYKLDKDALRTFRATGSIAYDDRILSWRLADSTVSIWTVAGRVRIPFVCGPRQRAYLARRKGESDLTLIRGKLYLLATCDVTEGEAIEPTGALGVDLGVRNIAVDSDGQVYSSSQVNNVRYRHRRLRSKLQKKGTKAARRRLRKLAGKEARFARDVNHTISKQLVVKAQGTARAIALEDLGGIRERVTVRRSQRATLHSWSFFQLRAFVEYKARRAGVPVVLVDPRNTSRTCPACGHVDKKNRPSQSKFCCVVCGFAGLADHIAACNVASRAAVNRPYVSDTPGCTACCQGQATLLLVGGS